MTTFDQATLRLFGAVQVDDIITTDASKFAKTLQLTLPHGFIFSPKINADARLTADAIGVVGLSGVRANAAFHKSWAKVENAPIGRLIMEQLVHYFTTYGYQALGVYSDDTIYVPYEELEIPTMDEASLAITLVKGLTHDEMYNKVYTLVNSGVALSQQSIDDLFLVITTNRYSRAIVDDVKNRELYAKLCDHYGIVPQEPVAFLRHTVNKLTGETLLVKNKALFDKLAAADGKQVDQLMQQAPGDLASIFYRFKPLFLAMRQAANNKTVFNNLRREAPTKHKPMPVDFLNEVTNRLKGGDWGRVEWALLNESLANANQFRKIRLAYALKYRLSNPTGIVHQVRTGAGYAKDFSWPINLHGDTEHVLADTLRAIADTLHDKVQGKVFYIPAGVTYAMPATEKQFTGNIPNGSYITVPEDMIVGIHWFDNGHKRVDLDLSVMGPDGKVGWDARYRTASRDVLFSGDMTSAPSPNGASELFYLRQGQSEERLLMCNFYNYNKGYNDTCDATILVAHEKLGSLTHNHMVDPNNIIAKAGITISKKQNVLGAIATVDEENRFYFANLHAGANITARETPQVKITREWLFTKMLNPLPLNSMLTWAGATVVNEPPEDGDYIDLSPAALEKTTLIELFS